MNAWILIASVTLAASPDVSSEARALLETAEGYLGVPYVYGDSGAFGFDCSAFVRTVFAEHGYTLPRTSSLQSTVGEPVSFEELRAGDLVFFNPNPKSSRISHVGIATGDGRMIHASSGRGEVVIDELSMHYYRRHRAAARRVLSSPFGVLGAPEMHDPRLTEHVVAPALTLGTSSSPTLWNRGPSSLQPEQSSVGAATATFVSSGETLVFAMPRAMWRADRYDATAAIQLPLAWRDDGSRLWSFSAGEDYLRILDRFRVGTSDAKAHFELSRDATLSLGDGSLVDRATPMTAHRGMPGVPIHAGMALSTHLGGRNGAVSLAMDDIVAPALIGAGLRGTGRLVPVAELAVDPQESTRTLAAAAGLELTLIDARSIEWTVRARAFAMNMEQTRVAASAGSRVLLRAKTTSLTLAADWSTFQLGFAPGYFGLDHRHRRNVGLYDSLVSDASRSGVGSGARVSALFAMTRRFALRGGGALYSTENATPLNSLEFGVIARALQLSSSFATSLSINYHQRFVERLRAPGFDADDDRELVFLSAALSHRSGAALEAHVARRPRSEQAAWEGSLALSFDFGL